MADYPKAKLVKRSRELVRCDRITEGGKPCGERLGRIVFSRTAEKRYFELLENPTFDAFDDVEQYEEAVQEARYDLVTLAYFEPRGTDELGNTGWIRRSDQEGDYIKLGRFAKKQLDDQKGEPRPRASLDHAGYNVLSGDKPFVSAQRRYSEPVRLWCRRCEGFAIVDPRELAEESTRRREMRSINFE